MFTFLLYLTQGSSPFPVSHIFLRHPHLIFIRSVEVWRIGVDAAVVALTQHTSRSYSRLIMTDPGALSAWWVAPSQSFPISSELMLKHFFTYRNPTKGIFSLNDQVHKPRPRAWERAPKSPVLARHHGRKVWKRYEPPLKPDRNEASGDAEQTRRALSDATNTARPVKRLRLKDAPRIVENGKENEAAQSLTTLRDREIIGTPRRECCYAICTGGCI